MIKPRCRKCGRILRDPESIARGMGPKCAGVSGGGHRVKVRVGHRGSSKYSLGLSGGVQATLPIINPAPMIQSEKELESCSREERQRLFEERKSFQCGLMLPEPKSIIYTPTHDGGWKNSNSDSVISRDQIQSYLKRYQYI